MIRFLADTWRDAILRPVAMAAPNSSVYIEIAAPDFRFAIALVLAVLVLISNRKTRHQPDRAGYRQLALFTLVFLSFIPWMHTTGNGRYFMPYLILIGPLCIALINLMQNTVGMKIFLVARRPRHTRIRAESEQSLEILGRMDVDSVERCAVFVDRVAQRRYRPSHVTYLTISRANVFFGSAFASSFVTLDQSGHIRTGGRSRINLSVYAPIRKSAPRGSIFETFYGRCTEINAREFLSTRSICHQCDHPPS
jgi:hypothetical protein